MSDRSISPQPELVLERPGRIGVWLTTTDHKRIGKLYLGTSLLFFLVAVVFAMLMRTQTIAPELEVLPPETYNQVFSMHGTIMIFLFGMPILVSLANYLVPLMIGAPDMAFPRLNALSYWMYLFGGILLLSSFLFGGALDTGWFSYAPLTEKPYSPHPGVTFWTVAILILGGSSLLGAVNFIVTMVKMRAPGMKFFQAPMFALATFLNSFLIIMAIPSLTAAVAMLYLDREFGTVFFKPEEGGSAVVWQHLFWFFGHPEVYILIVPAFGIMSEVVPVFSRKPLFGRTTMIIMIAIIGFLGFLVWAHHMFAVGLPNAFNAVMAGTSMLIAIPTGVKIFNWLATMWGGSLRFNTPMLFACGLIALFTVGGLTGVTVATVPFDWQVTDTYYIVGHLHNVLFPGTVFAVFAGIYYWFPKMTGRFLSERLGKWHFWLILVGFTVTFMPMYVLGLMGMPRRVYTYADGLGWNTLNLVSTLGAYLIAIALAVFFFNIFWSLRRGERATGNPWGAWTLEWATTSPPPTWNFDGLPPIKSDRPLWDLQHPEPGPGAAGGPPPAEIGTEAASAGATGPEAATILAAASDRGPSPAPSLAADRAPELGAAPWPHYPPEQSVVPILAGAAILAVGVGLLGSALLAFLGLATMLAISFIWGWERWPEMEISAREGERFGRLSIGMLVFLASEAVLFGSLIYAYIHLRLHAITWPPKGMEPLEVGFPAFNTGVLIASGVVAHYALEAYRKGNLVASRVLLVVTIVLGAAFLGGQAYEYGIVGFGLSDGLMGSTFFTLTGFHGAHVTGGLLILVAMYLRTVRDHRAGLVIPDRGSGDMMAAGTYYWHFVDAVWVVLFFVVYLL